MAKATLIEKGWAEYTAAMVSPRQRVRGEYSPQRARKDAHAELYDRLVAVAASFGVKVEDFDDRDRERVVAYRDGSGTAPVAGYCTGPHCVRLRYKSCPVLIHELAHALDFQLEFDRRDCERVATAATYIVMRTLGLRTVTQADYAAKQDKYGPLLPSQAERIDVIVNLIIEGLTNAPSML